MQSYDTSSIIGKRFEVTEHNLGGDFLPKGKYEYLSVNDKNPQMLFYLVKNIDNGSEHGASSYHLGKLIEFNYYKSL